MGQDFDDPKNWNVAVPNRPEPHIATLRDSDTVPDCLVYIADVGYWAADKRSLSKSEFFNKAFGGSFKEAKTSVVVFEDIDHEALEFCLRHCYPSCGEATLPPLRSHLDFVSWEEDKALILTFLRIYTTADFLMMSGLRRKTRGAIQIALGCSDWLPKLQWYSALLGAVNAASQLRRDIIEYVVNENLTVPFKWLLEQLVFWFERNQCFPEVVPGLGDIAKEFPEIVDMSPQEAAIQSPPGSPPELVE